MSESSVPARRRHNRANWVALRTLRQAPKVVGRTTSGDTVFEVRSVRLVLLSDARHFSRLVPCATCADDVPGPAVLGPTDLDHPVHGVICRECVKWAAPVLPTDERGQAVRQRPVLETDCGNGAGARNVEVATMADARLDALKQQMGELGGPPHRDGAEWEPSLDRRTGERPGSTAELRRQGPADLERRVQEAVDRLAQTVESQQAELQGALGKGLDEMRAAIMAVATSSESRLHALEEQVAKDQVAVSEQRELQTALDRRLGELRSEVAASRDAVREPTDGQVEVDRRLAASGELQQAARADQGRHRGVGSRSTPRPPGWGQSGTPVT